MDIKNTSVPQEQNEKTILTFQDYANAGPMIRTLSPEEKARAARVRELLEKRWAKQEDERKAAAAAASVEVPAAAAASAEVPAEAATPPDTTAPAVRVQPLVPQKEAPQSEIKSCSLREVLDLNPMPGRLDPVIRILLEGCDPSASHQVMTLVYPIFSFLGQNARVRYGNDVLRWISGQSWQMGGSGCGKSVVLRALEELFLMREMKANERNAIEAANYSMLSEKKRQETDLPQNEVRVMEGIPTALALLQQMQINGGGAIYISCTECGEFGKKIRNAYYALLLDMFKKSYDGTGEPFLHKSADRIYYVRSMKLCINIGGTIDPMYKIFRQCESDGTMARGALTILPERKDEETEGIYITPSWNQEQKRRLWEAAERLRAFDNRYAEDILDTDLEAVISDFDPTEVRPSQEELHDDIRQEQLRRALCLPEVVALGREIKNYLRSFQSEFIDDCCSRADERAMGFAYLLYIAGGEDRESLVSETIPTVRWWVKTCIDCAWAMQTQLLTESRSHSKGVRLAYKAQAVKRAGDSVGEMREKAFRDFEQKYEGQEKMTEDLREFTPFRNLDRTTLYRLVKSRGYAYVTNRTFLVKHHEAA